MSQICEVLTFLANNMVTCECVRDSHLSFAAMAGTLGGVAAVADCLRDDISPPNAPSLYHTEAIGKL